MQTMTLAELFFTAIPYSEFNEIFDEKKFTEKKFVKKKIKKEFKDILRNNDFLN